MKQHLPIPSLLFMVACWIPCNVPCDAGAQPLPATNALALPHADQVLPASDPRFHYEGRFDLSAPSRRGVTWEASRISLDFDGPTLICLFSNTWRQCFFDASVDGDTQVVELREGRPPVNTAFSHLGPGRHHLMLFKRSEAAAGTVNFEGVELAAGAQAWAPPAPAYKTTMEFIGDSIAAGACVEDGATDEWHDRRNHNSARSYTALTAAAFAADHRNISVSGIGIIAGFVPWTASQVWDRIYVDTNSVKADLAAWTPRIVFVHLGDNDDSYTRSHKEPFPVNFAEAYISFLGTVRAAYPNAEIVLLQGGMWNGCFSPALLGAWYTAVAKLESSDKKISHYAFKHWTEQHPRVADHQALADELIGWLNQQDFMKH